jgi:ATP-binding cassette, subfamily F, member 3
MITVTNLTVSFGGTTLFEDLNFQILPSDRIGLTGRNGAGKSTLLKIMCGYQRPSGGEISLPRECTAGYLPQEFGAASPRTVLDETLEAFSEIRRIESKMEALQKRVHDESEQGIHDMDLLTELHDLGERYRILDGYTSRERAGKVLQGLGFLLEDLEKPVRIFSGGWQMRIELAKLLLQQPDILLLDEPTNHLDIESIIWLENFLLTYPGAIVLISHDKAFLDRVTNRTIELTGGGMEDYKAPYSKYLILRQERREKMQSAMKNQGKQIRQMERNIERFRYKASKASFAQSLIKKLDKLERIELTPEDAAALRINFPDPPNSGKVIMRVEDLSKSFGEKQVIRPVSFSIDRCDRIAFVGKNGMGKTTLTKIMNGQLDYQGSLEFGHQVITGYFAQHQTATLNPDKTVLEEMEDAARDSQIFTRIRTILGAFLFSGDDVDKKIKVLSGGEKSRLALARMLLQPFNFLVLDEPTNHLDMVSKEVLKQALMKYPGTLVVVSHDREFLQGLTNRVFEFTEVGIRQHLGGIDEFLKKRQTTDMRELERNDPARPPVADQGGKEEYERRRKEEKQARKLKNGIEKSEKRIRDLEEEMGRMDKILNESDPGPDIDFFNKYEDLKIAHSAEMREWEKLVEEMERRVSGN